ncbi:putative immunity protein [Kallotenue papyrolyticum]|uniref:putative immunity protein n=1 Tax=Kallotenue papyrolyticum TaxID=1325125 RepID=UPI0009DD0B2A
MAKYKRYGREDQRALATWAADCAARVLPIFENAYPNDERPRKAIEACQTWVRTGIFKMAEIRTASLAAHAAARDAKAKGNEAACFAARAAGQAVGTAHVAQHAYGAALYALKAIAASNPVQTEVRLQEERNWQSQHLPGNLEDVMERIIIQKKGKRIVIKILKGEGF